MIRPYHANILNVDADIIHPESISTNALNVSPFNEDISAIDTSCLDHYISQIFFSLRHVILESFSYQCFFQFSLRHVILESFSYQCFFQFQTCYSGIIQLSMFLSVSDMLFLNHSVINVSFRLRHVILESFSYQCFFQSQTCYP